MVKVYRLNSDPLTLTSDLAGENPLYLYLSDDKRVLLYSQSIVALMGDTIVKKPLRVSSQGVSFLLQSGVVPPPKTAYDNIFIVGIGDSVTVKTKNGQIDLSFKHEFPFLNNKRLKYGEMEPDEDLILQLLAEATISQIDPSQPSFLFHSAGKDSNSIALALAEAGWQDKVTLISHKSQGKTDESEISKSIAKKLGFKHQVLYEVNKFDEEHKSAIESYFEKAPFPCTDNVSLAYPFYSLQRPELIGANLIDGMGNDVYIGHIPGKNEYDRQRYSKILKHARFLTSYAHSSSFFNVAGRTRCEWTGMFGFSYSDAQRIYSPTTDVSQYWLEKDNDLDYLDFRASIRGVILDPEIFTRKVRNFSNSISAKLILPWANQSVAEYFSKMPEVYLFDRNKLKNKCVLRTMLKDRMGLDSDVLGKMVFSYDSIKIVTQNWHYIESEIKSCDLWDHKGLGSMLLRMNKGMLRKGWPGSVSARLIYRLFLLSEWFNNHR